MVVCGWTPRVLGSTEAFLGASWAIRFAGSDFSSIPSVLRGVKPVCTFLTIAIVLNRQLEWKNPLELLLNPVLENARLSGIILNTSG